MQLKTVRNIAIIALIALGVVMIPGGGSAAELVLAIISLLFLAAIAAAGFRVYRENKLMLWSMTTQHRAMLYGSAAVIFLAIAGTSKFWETGLGVLLWFGVIVGAGFTAFTAIRESRRYTI